MLQSVQSLEDSAKMYQIKIYEHAGNNGEINLLTKEVVVFLKNTNRDDPKKSTRKMLSLVKSELKNSINHITVKKALSLYNIFAYSLVKQPILRANHIFRRLR